MEPPLNIIINCLIIFICLVLKQHIIIFIYQRQYEAPGIFVCITTPVNQLRHIIH